MKKAFYPRLAWTGIKSNRKLYTPFLLTCVGMVAMFYIMHALSVSELLTQMRGGSILSTILPFGTGVVGVFAAIFLFYTNSFLIRRRKKELGLYNILGMGKKDIGRVLLNETLISYAIAAVGGLVLGIALYKLAELGLVHFINAEVTYTFAISFTSVLITLAVFAGIFLILFLRSAGQVTVTKPVELLKSESNGEKPPKANWVIGGLGIVILAAAYYIAVSIKDPVATISWFFVAVIMVIVATYLIFIAGSVMICRLLQKNKKYYYNKKHFVSVSSMVYRMKRNGAGLASICILITMVLVMLSSTSSLYIGQEDSIKTRYPYDFQFSVDFADYDKLKNNDAESLKTIVDSYMKSYGGVGENAYGCSAKALGFLEGSSFDAKLDDYYGPASIKGDAVLLKVISIADYNRSTGKNVELSDGEALVFLPESKLKLSSLKIEDKELKLTYTDDKFIYGKEDNLPNIIEVDIAVKDFDGFAKLFSDMKQGSDQNSIGLNWNYLFNVNADEQTKINIDLSEPLHEYADKGLDIGFTYSSAPQVRADFYETYGGLFFLGIILSIIFTFAAVLIIYYKQVSEGYEDAGRFEIMQKIGMTKRDIRKSINSQMLTVFFMPIVFAVLHLAFAFPMIYKMLQMFQLSNMKLFVITTAVSVVAASVIYTIVYRITSNVYYSIVSNTKD